MGNVLVVEDDQAVCDVICETLREAGFNVEFVSSDREAYGRIAGLPTLDGVVLDVNLGQGTTGYDIARFARQVIPDVAIVYVSGDSPPQAFKAFGVPESKFIQKPFTADELVAAVTRQLYTAH